MNNTVGIYDLFEGNTKAKKAFYEWCKKSDEFCAYDIEKLEIDLFVPVIDNTTKYVYFSHANILDWLEENGYYIGIKVTPSLKYATILYYSETKNARGYPLYNNSGMNGRLRAYERGITKAIKHLEEKLNS